MILKALYDYYNRSGDLAPEGFENKEIHFIIVIDEKGQLINVEDRRIDKKKSQTFRPSRYSPWMTFTLTTQNIM